MPEQGDRRPLGTIVAVALIAGTSLIARHRRFYFE